MSEKFAIYSKIFFSDVGNFFRHLCELVLRHQMRVSNYFVNSFYSVVNFRTRRFFVYKWVEEGECFLDPEARKRAEEILWTLQCQALFLRFREPEMKFFNGIFSQGSGHKLRWNSSTVWAKTRVFKKFVAFNRPRKVFFLQFLTFLCLKMVFVRF